MRICMITSAPMPPAEGVGYYVWNLSRFLKGQGHEVQIITRRQRRKSAYEELEGVPIWRPRFYPLYPVHVHLHMLFVQRLVWQLETKVDLFHLHTPLPPPIQSVRPYVVTVHTPMLGEARAIPVKDLRSLAIRLQIPVSACIERRLFATAGTIVAVAHSVAEELRGYGLRENQVEVLGNGVDTDIFCPGGQGQSSKTDETYVLAVGRLDVRKGLEDLIGAMSHVVSHFPAVRLYIAGAGPIEAQLKAKAEQMGLDRAVRFLGHVEQADIVELYRGATVFTHAAHYEGLPTVLLEAMACRKAVVSTSVSGALDVVRGETNGLLVPPQAPEKLAAAICRLLGDATLRTWLGAAARRSIEERFSWHVVGSDYLRCYQTLLGEAGR